MTLSLAGKPLSVLLSIAPTLGVALAIILAAPCHAHADGFAQWSISGYGSQTRVVSDTRLEIDFEGNADWPHVALRPRVPIGLNGVTTIVLPVENPGAQAIDLFIRIGDDEEATWPEHALAARYFLPPHSTATLAIATSPHDPRLMGMQDAPPPVGAKAGQTVPLGMPSGHLEKAHWASLYLVIWGRSGPRSLVLGRPSVASFDWGLASYTGLIDRYGQFARGAWSARIASDGDLTAQRAAEERFEQDLDVTRPGQDRYGGWSKGEALASTGYFHVARSGAGRWSLVTPEGHPFFSLGVDTIERSDARTFVAGREFMFEDLAKPGIGSAEESGSAPPAPEGVARRMPRFNAGGWVNFYVRNLARKYGGDFAARWPDQVLHRLAAWGFNTVGNWSDPALWARHALPYTVPVSIDPGTATVPGGAPDIADLPDPFAASFEKAADRAFATAADPRRDDPWLVGYFVDNELPWGDGTAADPRARCALALRVLALGAQRPAKAALVRLLRERHPDLAAFNAAWGTSLASWTALADAGPPLPETLAPVAEADLAAYGALFADTYYRIVAQTLHRHDPHHLYLGSRFAAQTGWALDACERWCDVLSFNIYARDLADALAARVGARDKPLVIGEFNFSSAGQGPFGRGLVDVGSQRARGQAYAAYVSAAASDRRVIGVHWFQYLDEPSSGRLLDGENSPFGLVAVTDTPYWELLDFVRRTNLAVFRVRTGSAP